MFAVGIGIFGSVAVVSGITCGFVLTNFSTWVTPPAYSCLLAIQTSWVAGSTAMPWLKLPIPG